MPRPDPEALLKRVQEEEVRARRARFKVFFGAAPGVGKTYAMLQEAQRLKWEGVDVVAGVVETHQRAETQALLAGLPCLPAKTLHYRGVALQAFDLDGALARRPALILVDELAHSNAAGCRHAKRWQDVMELLDAGIDVYSTLNVQHLESLKEVVAQITGVLVQERVPDTVLDRCDEMELVDISVEELIQRLAEGKVYVPEQAKHAVQRFFRRGNLLALRELALRRTADLVDADMQRYREVQGIQDTWAASQRLMVGITPASQSEGLIRETCRMAAGAPWMAVFVDYGKHLNQEDRERLESHLRLAERLGGEGVALPGHGTLTEDLLSLAKGKNVTQILLGRSHRPVWWSRLSSTLVSDLSAQAGAIHVHLIPTEKAQKPLYFHKPAAPLAPWPSVGTLGLCAFYVLLATLLSFLIYPHIELADVVMLFTIPILVSAIRHGRNAALLTSVMAVLMFDLFFIPPRFTFAVGDAKHLGTFAVMLGMGFVIGNLAERLRDMAFRAQRREQRTLAIYRLGKDLVASHEQADILALATKAVEAQFHTQVGFYLPTDQGQLQVKGEHCMVFQGAALLGVAQWVFQHGQAAGQGTDVLPATKALFLPLRGVQGVLGVMGIQSEADPFWQEADQRHLLDSFANQTALALERTRLAMEANATKLKAKQEEIRSTLLSSVSHDLRTPLAGITGSATALLEDPGRLSESEKTALLSDIQEEAARMHRLVSNLLDITRLESGAIPLKQEWLPAEELVGVALKSLESVLAGREVQVRAMPPGTLVHGDPVLLAQLVINLVDNALKYGEHSPIEITLHQTGRGVTLMVQDKGPGIPAGMEERIFDKLFRLPGKGSGAGLGLAICQGIVALHHGSIQASNRPEGGAQLVVTLPYGEAQPMVPCEEETGGVL